jgi:hypothetical protein
MEQITLGAPFEHNDLLNYHKKLTERVDNEIETKTLNRKIAAMAEPAVHVAHPYAEVSHKMQNEPTQNTNNEKVAARVKGEFEAIKIDDNLSLQEKEAQEAKLAEAMKQQITNASLRKDLPVISLTPVTTIAASNEATSPAPAVEAATGIPSWPPLSSTTAPTTAPALPWTPKAS